MFQAPFFFGTMPRMSIKSFSGRYRFLSNFYPATVLLEGHVYPSVEHAYQAAKFPPGQREPFRNPDLKAGQAKRMGHGKGGPDWRRKSLLVMRELVLQKFFYHHNLKELLLRTGDVELVEGNTWGDTFFGVCNGVGENYLGKILMDVRKEVA